MSSSEANVNDHQSNNMRLKYGCSNLPSNSSGLDKTPASGIRKRKNTESSGNGNRVEGSITNTSDSWLIEAKKSIGGFLYENGIDFDVAKSPSFHKMASLGFGPNFQIPTCDELKGLILENDLKETNKYVNEIISSWAETGASILIDGWANDESKNFVSIFVDSPKGTIYLRSIDVSDFHANLEAMKLLFEQVIEEVGISNVVQIITYSTSVFMKEIGKQLMKKYTSICWAVDTSCCIDLMIEKYGAIVSDTLEKAKIITRYVCSHPQLLKLVLDHPTEGQLVSHSNTKLSISFVTLENILSKEKILKEIILSSGSQTAIVTSSAEDKRVADLVGDILFWSNAKIVVTAAIPLVCVMDWMKKNRSHVAYIYEKMTQAKETIKEGFGINDLQYMQFWNVIDEIWTDHLYSSLHTVGYFLNPCIFYSEDLFTDTDLTIGFANCILHMANKDICVGDQLETYNQAWGNFAAGSGVEEISNVSPVDWWYKYGGHCPELQKLAIRVLSQTCIGASRFQLERSLVENLFRRGRTQREQDKLTEMVHIQYNTQLSKLASAEI